MPEHSTMYPSYGAANAAVSENTHSRESMDARIIDHGTARSITMRELIDGLESVVQQIDQLVRSVAGDAGAKAGEAGEQMTASLHAARERLEDIEQDLKHALKGAAKSTGRYVKDHPWPAIAIAAAVGFVVGALLASRRD
jgi:ElaB/YqjD/DUF883 family membrane-anchored ribosome-binding protein